MAACIFTLQFQGNTEVHFGIGLKHTRIRRQEHESDKTFCLRSTFRHKTLGLRKSRLCDTDSVRLQRASLFIGHAPISDLSMSQLLIAPIGSPQT